MSPKRVARAMGLFGAAALAVVLAVAIYVVRHRSPATTLQQMAVRCPTRCCMRTISSGRR